MGKAIGLFVVFVLFQIWGRLGILDYYRPHVQVNTIRDTYTKCSTLDVIGAEDLALDSASNLIFISSSARRPSENPNGIIKSITPAAAITEGSIFFVPASGKDKVPKKANLKNFNKKLAPHGISTYTSNGKTLLFVINHANGETVEIFKHNGNGDLEYQKTVEDSSFISINDLLAVGEDKFYVSNDHGSALSDENMLKRFAELLFPEIFAAGSVVYYDGTKGTTVLEDLRMPNGIAMSPDKKRLYVSESAGWGVDAYNIISPTKLEYAFIIEVNQAPDNLEVDPKTGDLWVAGSPNKLSFLKYFFSSTADLPPSKVDKVIFEKHISPRQPYNIITQLNDDGNLVSCSSFAYPYGDSFWVGTVFGGVLVCEK